MSHAALQAEADQIRETGALGRSEPVRKLFDYLVRSSLEDRSPKEAEVAAAVFSRRADFDANQDAVVRVYVHKLRRKLEALYAGPRAGQAHRLTIPRGEYRLVVEHQPEPAGAVLAPAAVPIRRRWLLALAAVALIVLSSGATWLALQAARPQAVKDLEHVRRGPIWAPLLANRFPTLVVVGDYYIFGESDDGMQVNRLVREYSVNSESELDDFLMAHPDKVSHYIDLDLRYLPVGAAYALRDVLPVLTPGKTGPVKVILASDLTPGMLKTNNIVYIGYFSAMGVLRDAAFAGSRFSIGETYDDLIDGKTHHHYDSQGGGPDSNGAMYVDYGYVSTFKGPAGNRVVVVAGTRDVALMQAADAATNRTSIGQMTAAGQSPDAFEALYEAQGMSRLNVAGKLLVASPLDAGKIWSGPGGKVYPAG